MRRLLLVLALVLGAAACGDDGGGSAAGTTTSASTTTASTAPSDPAAQVDEFCAKTDEIKALFESAGDDPSQPPSSADEARISALLQEAAPMMVTLQMSTAQMLPGDIARFQECSAVLGGTGGIPELPEGS